MDTNGTARSVTVVGNYAYVADDTSGLAIIDITDPTNPGTPIYVDTNGEARGVAISGNYAYVADGSSGLAIINISDPNNPGSPTYINLTSTALDVTVSGNYAYIANQNSGLAIINDNSILPVLDHLSIRTQVVGLIAVNVFGNYAFIANKNPGLAIIDISDPTSPGTPTYTRYKWICFGCLLLLAITPIWRMILQV